MVMVRTSSAAADHVDGLHISAANHFDTKPFLILSFANKRVFRHFLFRACVEDVTRLGADIQPQLFTAASAERGGHYAKLNQAGYIHSMIL
jgi:hypothetical protein